MLDVDLIIAIDPATSFGWAVFRVENGTPVRVESGALKTKGPWGERFLLGRKQVVALIKRHSRKGDTVWLAYEDIQARTLKSWDNYRVVTGLISAVYTAATLCDIPVHQIAPAALSSVKLHATGNGHADKSLMVEAFTRRYGREPVTDDEADAAHIGTFLCEVLHDRIKKPDSIAWRRIWKHHGVVIPAKAAKKRKRKTKTTRKKTK